jgi:hypothetical protein
VSIPQAGAYTYTKTKLKIFFACGALKTQDTHMLDHPDRGWSRETFLLDIRCYTAIHTHTPRNRPASAASRERALYVRYSLHMYPHGQHMAAPSSQPENTLLH